MNKRVIRDREKVFKILKALGFEETKPGQFKTPAIPTDPISARYPGISAHIELNTGEDPVLVLTHASLFVLSSFVWEALDEQREVVMGENAAWVPCPNCENYWCRIHEKHVFICDCPPLYQWKINPYIEGGPTE